MRTAANRRKLAGLAGFDVLVAAEREGIHALGATETELACAAANRRELAGFGRLDDLVAADEAEIRDDRVIWWEALLARQASLAGPAAECGLFTWLSGIERPV